MDFVDYRVYLDEIYRNLKSADRTVTYLKFAALLGFSESNVIWMVIKGRRKLTHLTSQRIATTLDLDTDNRKYFFALVSYINERSTAKKDALFTKLMEVKHSALSDGSDQLALEYFSEWFHPVLRELARDHNISTNPSDIANRLIPRILPREAESSIKLLSRLGLVEVSEDKMTFSYKGENIIPSRRINQHASIRFHHIMMDMAKEALVKIPETHREYNGLTLSLSDEMIPRAQEIIRKACMELLELENVEQGRRDVFQVNMQMFPFTRKD